MRRRQRTFPGLDPEPRRVTKAETYAAVQHVLLALLRQRGHATADQIRDHIEIPAAGLPAIGRAISHLQQIGAIEAVDMVRSTRRKAHARPLRVWRLAQIESPTG